MSASFRVSGLGGLGGFWALGLRVLGFGVFGFSHLGGPKLNSSGLVVLQVGVTWGNNWNIQNFGEYELINWVLCEEAALLRTCFT